MTFRQPETRRIGVNDRCIDRIITILCTHR